MRFHDARQIFIAHPSFIRTLVGDELSIHMLLINIGYRSSHEVITTISFFPYNYTLQLHARKHYVSNAQPGQMPPLTHT